MSFEIDTLPKPAPLPPPKPGASVIALVFVVFVVVVSLSGWRMYASARAEVESEAAQSLMAVDRLKAGELAMWLRERRSDAAMVMSNPANSVAVVPFFDDPSDPARRTLVTSWLRAIHKDSYYSAVKLADTKGRVYLTYPEGRGTVEPEERDPVEEAVRSQKDFLAPIHVSSGGRVEADQYVPLLVPDGRGGSVCVGVMILEIDPQDFLYPFIQSWPTRSGSAETVLAQKEGAYGVILHKVRHLDNAPMTLRLPLSTERVGARAMHGEEGLVTGLDYRGVPVMAVLRRIPDSPWYMTTKVDLEEVVAPLRSRALVIAGFLTAMVVTTGLALLVWSKRREADFYQRQFRLERERERQAAVIAQQQQIFELILEQTLAGSWDWHLPEKRLVLSPRLKASLGYGVSEIEDTQDAWQALVHPDDMPGLLALFDRYVACRGEIPYQLEVRYLHKDGSVVTVMCVGLVIEWGQDGAPLRMVGAHADISALKRTEAALRESESKLLALFSGMTDVILVMGRDGRYLEIAPTNPARLYRPSQELLGRRMHEVMPAQQADFFLAKIRDALESRQPVIMEYSLEVETDTVWFSATVSPLSDSSVIIVARDVTLTKQVELELRASEARYRALFQGGSDAVFLFELDDDGAPRPFLEVNDVACERLGLSREQLLTMTVQDIRDPALPPLKDVIAELRQTRRQVVESVHRAVDGTAIPVEISLSLFELDEGFVVLAIARDITDRLRVESELKRARDLAEMATRAKSEFLANMSHELRTPLNSVIGFSEMLEDQIFGPLNAKQARYVGNILSAGRHLLSLINDILDLSKIEAGKMTMEPQTLTLHHLVSQVIELTRARARKHDLALRIEVPRDLTVTGDERMMKQVLFNLLSNATKFTPDGGSVVVSARRDEAGVRVSVADTGIGIAPSNQERIFAEFEQVDSSRSREHAGTGLGLALCRRFVGMHGGRIWVESEGEGRGATFHFTLPDGVAAGGCQHERAVVADE